MAVERGAHRANHRWLRARWQRWRRLRRWPRVRWRAVGVTLGVAVAVLAVGSVGVLIVRQETFQVSCAQRSGEVVATGGLGANCVDHAGHVIGSR